MTHKHYEIAYRAHCNTSFSPEKRAVSYCNSFDEDIKALQALDVPQSKIDKYERLWLDWMAAKSRCLSSMITGPANFPVARAEKANNSEHKKGQECMDYYNKLVNYAKKEAYYKDHPEARPVMSGDSDALERLQVKLDACIKAQETMKTANKILRTEPLDMNALIDLLGEKAAKKIIVPDCFGGVDFASFSLNNNRAEIKRLEGRIKVINQKKEQGDQEIEVNGIKIVQNSDDMRLQIFFDGKPSDEIRMLLKKNAFKWAPSKGAWQRQLTDNAISSFKNYVLPELKKMEA